MRLPEDKEEPPGKPRRHPKWNDVPDEQWDDWRWQMQNAIRTTSQLAEFFSYGPQEFAALESLEQKYKLAIPPYYFSLINLDDPLDPIRLQSLPSPLEQSSTAGVELEDPLEEDKDSPGARPDAPLSGSRAAGDHARLHDVLPVLHAQARDHGSRRLGRPQPQRPADDRIRPRAPRDPRRDRLGRRPAVAAAGADCSGSSTSWPTSSTST